MAFEELEKGSCELEETYPKFDEIGDYVEGHFYGLEQGDYGKQIVLYKGEDEYGEEILQILPAHKNLRKYYSKLKVGDYIKVELTKIKPSTNANYGDVKFYKVYVDPDRAIEFETDDDGDDEDE